MPAKVFEKIKKLVDQQAKYVVELRYRLHRVPGWMLKQELHIREL
ncbi:MAG: hypothetical protein ACYSUK_04625 [Planctomycetota bacterium]